MAVTPLASAASSEEQVTRARRLWTRVCNRYSTGIAFSAVAILVSSMKFMIAPNTSPMFLLMFDFDVTAWRAASPRTNAAKVYSSSVVPVMI